MNRPIDPTGEVVRHQLPSGLIHELRTPLNQIIGYSELLIEQETGNERLAPDLRKVHAAGHQLLTLIVENFGPIRDPESPHAGAVQVESNSYDVRVAVVEPTTKDSGPAEKRLDASHGFLLVVDDNESNRDLLSHRLARQGYTVSTAESGREALAKLREDTIDLVLLDIMMPEMDGYEVLRNLKADDRLKHIPVIMISALSEMESVVRCIKLGAEDYLPKPFDPTLLKARIGACLEKKHSRDREVALFQQLQHNFKRLQELEKLRDDLTNMIVHDLRTPLTSLLVGMETLDLVGELNEVQRNVKSIAVAGGQTLLGLINDLLDVEKLESGTMQLDLEELSAAGLVAAAVGQVVSLAESKRLTLLQEVSPDLPFLQGDGDKLRRTLVNLIGNAIKFTPSGGSVTVEAHCSQEERSVAFSVADTGEGIPAESFERIFEKFGQVESRQSGRKMSTGLGLTFCKLAVEAHNGHIGVESLPGQGSKFYFTIPLP